MPPTEIFGIALLPLVGYLLARLDRRNERRHEQTSKRLMELKSDMANLRVRQAELDALLRSVPEMHREMTELRTKYQDDMARLYAQVLALEKRAG